MNRELLKELHVYFSTKENKTHKEDRLLVEIESELLEFPVLTVTRDDLEQHGFDITNVKDNTMEELSIELRDATSESFWSALQQPTTLGLSRPKCPACSNIAADFDGVLFYCVNCHNEW